MLPKKAFLHGLAYINSIGPRRYAILQKFFDNDPEKIWNNFNHWPKNLLSGKSHEQARSLTENFDLKSEWQKLQNQGIRLLSMDDPDYPYLLKQINDPPFALYCRGKLPDINRPLITIVGTRNMTEYGRQVCENLIPPLIKSGLGIISGLAYGVDACAHRLALGNSGYTAAVLASGVDFITPRQNEKLGQQIIESGGAVISEYVPGTECQPGGFPRRNRILAGLSPLTLVIEAAVQSGALLTANLALDYNRELASIPGSIFSETSEECHNLIKQGARCITSADEILDFYQIENCDLLEKVAIELNDQEKKVLCHLTTYPVPLDELISLTQIPGHRLLSILSSLELMNLVRQDKGLGYKLKNT